MNSCTECERPRYAKGLCRRHYAFTLYVDETCDGCGQGFKTEPDRRKRYPRIYCGMDCRSRHIAAERARRAGQIAVIIPESPIARTIRALALAAAVSDGTTWHAGTCAACGHHYIARRPSVTCGPGCAEAHRRAKRAAYRARRRARQATAFVETVYRARIFKRDNYTCQLCGEALDMSERAPSPLAPTIDHIVPLAKRGTHQPSNVQAAHFLCNSTKGARRSA